MISASYRFVKNNLDQYCDMATKEGETIIITRKSGDNVVLLSESKYSNFMKNLYIRSNNAYYNELLKSIKQSEKSPKTKPVDR